MNCRNVIALTKPNTNAHLIYSSIFSIELEGKNIENGDKKSLLTTVTSTGEKSNCLTIVWLKMVFSGQISKKVTVALHLSTQDWLEMLTEGIGAVAQLLPSCFCLWNVLISSLKCNKKIHFPVFSFIWRSTLIPPNGFVLRNKALISEYPFFTFWKGKILTHHFWKKKVFKKRGTKKLLKVIGDTGSNI